MLLYSYVYPTPESWGAGRESGWMWIADASAQYHRIENISVSVKMRLIACQNARIGVQKEGRKLSVIS